MGSIHTKIVIKETLRRKDKLIREEVVMTKAEFLRLHSAIARKETDEEMQLFFDTFRI